MLHANSASQGFLPKVCAEYSFTLVGRERQENSTTEEIRVDTSMLTTKLHPLLFTVHFNILLTVNKPTLNVTENFKNAVPGKKITH